MNFLVTVKRPNRLLAFLKNNILLILILLSIVIGFGIGIGIKNSSLDKDDMLWFVLPGTLFIRSLEMLIVPVVFIGVVAATSSLSAKNNLKITLICVGLTFLTHILATICGLAGALIVNALSLKVFRMFENFNSIISGCFQTTIT
jgi:Na+/H+-dicarboxylate symporter